MLDQVQVIQLTRVTFHLTINLNCLNMKWVKILDLKEIWTVLSIVIPVLILIISRNLDIHTHPHMPIHHHHDKLLISPLCPYPLLGLILQGGPTLTLPIQTLTPQLTLLLPTHPDVLTLLPTLHQDSLKLITSTMVQFPPLYTIPLLPLS